MIEKTTIGSEDYLSKKYLLNDKTVNVRVLISKINPKMVHGEKFRYAPSVTNANISTISLVTPDELFYEMDFIFETVKRIDPKEPNIVIPLKELCDGHIKMHNRIIDVDLETYLDRVFMFAHSIDQIQTKEDGIYIRKQLRTFIIEEIKDYLWVNVHSDSENYNSYSRPTLTKYSQLSSYLRSNFLNQ